VMPQSLEELVVVVLARLLVRQVPVVKQQEPVVQLFVVPLGRVEHPCLVLKLLLAHLAYLF